MALLSTIFSTNGNAQVLLDYYNEPAGSISYFQNQGQVIGADGNMQSKVYYSSFNAAPKLYLMDWNTIRFSYISRDTVLATPDTLWGLDMTHVGEGLNNAEPLPYEPTGTFHNYYLGHIPNGVEGVEAHKRIVYTDIYDGIDLHIYSNKLGHKFYYVFNPGSDPNELQIQFAGHDSLVIDIWGDLKIYLKQRYIKLPEAVAYQDNNGTVQSVSWGADYQQLNGVDQIGFYFGSYDTNLPLILQIGFYQAAAPPAPPIANLDWSTYAGSNETDESYAVTLDADGNPYITGYTYDPNFPVDVPFQSFPANEGVMMGTEDIFVTKFNKMDKKIVWSTFHGGTGTAVIGNTYTQGLDQANDIDAYTGSDPNLEYVFITGVTWCDDFPLENDGIFSNAMYEANNPEYIRAIVAAYNQLDGVLAWSTTHGTDEFSEEGVCIDVDANGVLAVGGGIIGGSIDPNNPLPGFSYVLPSGAWSRGPAGGFFLLFNEDYDVEWATPFGSLYSKGFVSDIKVLRVSPHGFRRLFLVGRAINSWSNGNDLDEVAQWGSYGGGDSDAYFAVLDAENYEVLMSTYWGGNGNDGAVAITQDNEQLVGNITAVGFTQSSDLDNTDLPLGWNIHSTTLNGATDMFLLEFNVNGALPNKGTLYGGNERDIALDVCFDDRDLLFVSGETRSTAGFVQTSNSNFYHQSVLGNDVNAEFRDASILVMDSDGDLVWTTKFGGLLIDKGWGIAAHGDEELLLTGTTGSHQMTFPLQEFDDVSVVDWYDDDLTNNSTTIGGGNARGQLAFMHDDFSVLESGTFAADAYIASFDIEELVVGMSDNDLDIDLILFPDPVVDQLYLSLDPSIGGQVELSIYDAIGQLVKKISVVPGLVNVDVSMLAKDMYILQVDAKDCSGSAKFLKE